VDADQIIVLGPEGVLERGNHQQLMQRNGVYRKMWLKQEADPNAV
jgi:ABC-type transport system involved in Fe-S cluster assembly fused permease/ATPase subunit